MTFEKSDAFGKVQRHFARKDFVSAVTAVTQITDETVQSEGILYLATLLEKEPTGAARDPAVRGLAHLLFNRGEYERALKIARLLAEDTYLKRSQLLGEIESWVVNRQQAIRSADSIPLK